MTRERLTLPPLRYPEREHLLDGGIRRTEEKGLHLAAGFLRCHVEAGRMTEAEAERRLDRLVAGFGERWSR